MRPYRREKSKRGDVRSFEIEIPRNDSTLSHPRLERAVRVQDPLLPARAAVAEGVLSPAVLGVGPGGRGRRPRFSADFGRHGHGSVALAEVG